MSWLRQSLTSPFGIYVRGFFSFSFSRLKLFTPKIVNPLYWNVFANPKKINHNTPFVVAELSSDNWAKEAI